ncbi:MAG: metallophosphoesterase [Deltaproteobacteria bacterium]|nr:metallophosphoesterase [Deltaproteobacteria bacterium]
MSRTILVGDVHGCIEELEALLKACAHTADDQVVLVGDLVAKGPDSAAVVQLARESSFEAVLGNHDDHVLSVIAAGEASAKRAHHAQVAATLTKTDVAWLQAVPLYLDESVLGPGLLVVHGGLVPGIPLREQSRKHLLNLRSFADDGTPSRKIEGVPWASRWPGPARVVFGHDALRGLQQHPHATGLDTGCVYGHRLTALVLPENRLVSVAAKRAYSGFDT